MTPEATHSVQIIYRRPSRPKATREEEKEASREADEKALSGGADPAAIEAKNAFVTAKRTIVHWERSRPL